MGEAERLQVEALRSAVPTEKVLSSIDTDIANRQAELNNLVIDTDAKFNAWTTTATTWNSAIRWIDGERLALAKPVREFIDQHINQPFNERLTAMRELFNTLKSKLAAYKAEQEKAQREAEEKARKEYEANLARQAKLSQKPEAKWPAVKQPLAPPPVQTRLADKIFTEWNYTVVDIDKVPREWLLNEDGTLTASTESRITQAIRRKANPVRNIPGLIIESKKKTRY